MDDLDLTPRCAFETIEEDGVREDGFVFVSEDGYYSAFAPGPALYKIWLGALEATLKAYLDCPVSELDRQNLELGLKAVQGRMTG